MLVVNSSFSFIHVIPIMEGKIVWNCEPVSHVEICLVHVTHRSTGSMSVANSWPTSSRSLCPETLLPLHSDFSRTQILVFMKISRPSESQG
jgi:hypothetical protein